MATDISLSNCMVMKEGIDRKYVGGGRMKRGEGGQEQIQAVKLQSYNKILDYTFLLIKALTDTQQTFDSV